MVATLAQSRHSVAHLDAEVNATDKNMITGLVCAALGGYTGKVEALVQLGAVVDAADKIGKTAKDWATDNGHTENLDFLKERA